MRYVTVLGAGLLVGTALAVIIPEGVNALYTSGSESSHHDHEIPLEHKIMSRQLQELNQNVVTVKPVIAQTQKTSEHKHSENNHSAIGVTLILGFVFMLIVDNFSSRLFHHHGSQGLIEIISRRIISYCFFY